MRKNTERWHREITSPVGVARQSKGFNQQNCRRLPNDFPTAILMHARSARAARPGPPFCSRQITDKDLIIVLARIIGRNNLQIVEKHKATSDFYLVVTQLNTRRKGGQNRFEKLRKILLLRINLTKHERRDNRKVVFEEDHATIKE